MRLIALRAPAGQRCSRRSGTTRVSSWNRTLRSQCGQRGGAGSGPRATVQWRSVLQELVLRDNFEGGNFTIKDADCDVINMFFFPTVTACLRASNSLEALDLSDNFMEEEELHGLRPAQGASGARGQHRAADAQALRVLVQKGARGDLRGPNQRRRVLFPGG